MANFRGMMLEPNMNIESDLSPTIPLKKYSTALDHFHLALHLPLQKFNSIWDAESSHFSFHFATKMVLHKKGLKFVTHRNEKMNGRIVKISNVPFAKGGFRKVYNMTEGSAKLVAKESRHFVVYADRLRFHLETCRCHFQSDRYARAFNDSTSKIETVRIPQVSFLKTSIYRLKDGASPGGYKYLAVEPRLEGSYKKFNGNNGYVRPPPSVPFDRDVAGSEEDGAQTDVAQAFSHFSFERSGGTEMVVDIQGVATFYTDPQLHSISSKYGRADRGERGMEDFFRTHVCNSFCRALRLKKICIIAKDPDSFQIKT
mmetsp:Transcript_27871/g.55859  ORF Transcript_27871/g.55859 Transcript_27871/m.55859 type:complete len:314 (+) Transcript_27871:105-1046(+)